MLDKNTDLKNQRRVEMRNQLKYEEKKRKLINDEVKILLFLTLIVVVAITSVSDGNIKTPQPITTSLEQ